jgi:DNA-binding response OmpR family regulator
MEGKVLVVAGDWRIRRLVRANLEALGLRVEQAANGQQGLELLLSERPDLLLVDLDQLDTDAGHWLSTLRSALGDRRLPLVVLSTEPLARRILWEHGADGFLQKPFAASLLLKRVRQALGSEG